MKKMYITAFAALSALFAGTTAKAQLSDLSYAEDFTVTDINGNQHNLYTYLNQGKTVFIDVSAAWCGPCWSFHQSGKLETLWSEHGPTGASGVSANTTNDVVVLFLEGELTNTGAQLTGTTTNQSYSGYTQGNWVNGTLYPIVDLTNGTILNDYNINYFPTLYRICPNRIVTEMSTTMSVAQLYSSAQACAPLPTLTYDPALLNYSGDLSACNNGTQPIKVRLQNMGTQPLTSASIEAVFNNQSVGWINWTGNLAKFEVEEVTVDEWFFPQSNGTIFCRVTSANNNTANDIVEAQTITVSNTISTTQSITIKVTTDAYGSETSWRLKKSNGQTVAQGSGFADHLDANNQAIAGEYPQADRVVNLPAMDCYSFEINDAYGDGMCCTYGNGAYQVIDNNTNTIVAGGNFFGSEVTKFGWSLTGIEEEKQTTGVKVFPNPSTGNFNLDLNLATKSNVGITVTNAMGQVVYNESKQNIAAGQHIYNMNLAGFADGIYMVTVNAGDKRYTQPITIVK